LKEHDAVARITFIIGFLGSVHDGAVDPQSVFFSMMPGYPDVER
jgi:hypothetical protein